jgi:hypothetical protein
MSDGYESEYQEVARLQYDEIEKLRAALDQLRTENQRLLRWIMGEEPDALAELQRVYSDPKTSENNKVRAAIGAIAFERSKPASVSVVVDFKSRVHDARMTTVELRKQEWSRPAEPLDLDAPTPATILGGDREGEALGPDPQPNATAALPWPP